MARTTARHDPVQHRGRPRRNRWAGIVQAAFWLIAVATVVGLLALFPWGGPPEADQAGFAQTSEERFAGRIVGVEESPVQDDFLLPGSVAVTVDVVLDDGRQVTVETVDEAGIFDLGRRVEVSQVAATGTPEIWAIVDLPRGAPLLGLSAVFVLAVVALGRFQGVRALVGLVLSALLIVAFLVPAVLDGSSPTVLALVTATAVMLVTLPLSHGFDRPVVAAAVGTALALALTVGLAVVAVELTGLTGLASEDVQLVRFSTGQSIDLRGLLLAGMIVGTLGVLDDVTVSQASTVAALRRANPTLSAGRVFGEALAVGRDHIAATVNTLFLAYAGAALPLLILFSVGDAPLGETLTSELVAQEIVRTLVGSIGLIAAVPLVTGLAALTLDGSEPDHGHSHGDASTHPVAEPSSPAPPPVPPAEATATDPEAVLDPDASLRRLFRLDDDGEDPTE